LATQNIGNEKIVACTLTSADLATQSERWKRLGERALIERVETEDGLLISFHREPGVADELRELVAVENECCSWADWTVATRAERVVLDVSSNGEGVATLHAMFTSLQRHDL
jgi:hypothetical protein